MQGKNKGRGWEEREREVEGNSEGRKRKDVKKGRGTNKQQNKYKKVH